MKNFTAAMISFNEHVFSNSSQSKTVKKSDHEHFINNRANLFKNISTRNFLNGFYGIFLGLLKIVKGRVSAFGVGLNSLGKYRSYLDLVTGSRVYLDRSLIVVLVNLLTINAQTAQAQCTGVAGTVFRDFNLNGKKDTYDIGLAGVTVKAFNSANAQIGATATTAADGNYSITGATGQVRVEFSGLPTDYVSGPDGTNSSTSLQFVTANACNVDYGVNHPEDFCAKDGVQPKVAVPCYANGIYSATGTNGAGLEDALVSFAYNKTGDKATTGNAPYLMSSYNKIGAVWGMAYNKYNKTLFTTAFMKRHSGFGPKGIAGLYVVQNADNNGSGYTITGINLETVAGLSIGFAGTEPTRNLTTDKTQPSDDGGNAVFNAVGKMSFGDCELSEDGNTLYITNLFDKKIYALNVLNPLAPTLIGSFLVPSPGCAVDSEYEPFGLKYYRGKLYVGVICTAQSSQPASNGLSSANLKATVYELNSGTFTTVLPSFSLNYDRGFSNSSSTSFAIWRPWVSTWSQVPSNISETYPQPMLSDIEFDTDGSMILGFADRFSHQLGNSNYTPGQTSIQTGRVEGDVMRASKSGSIWTIENNGTASGTTTSGANKGGGPGGGEYYFGDLTIDHDEPAMGGLLLFPGTGEIMTTTAGSANIFYSGGTRRMNNQTGDYLYTGAPIAWNNVSGYRSNFDGRPSPTGDYKLYNGNTPGTFGKASGLGDMEIFCSLAPLEIGNRIWRDNDQDGIQNANEPGISSITVLLFKAGVQVASTSTNTAGEYYFNDANVTGGLLSNTAYQIRVLTSQVGNTFLSPKDAGGNDIADSDADGTIVSGYAVIDLTTGVYGESNHKYDVGFSPNCPFLSNPQPNSGNGAICAGDALSLSLTASNVGTQPLPVATSIKWCAFNSVQTDPYTTTGATCLTTASTTTLADGTITANNLTGLSSTPGTYYIYALLNPTPDANNPNCRPYVSYIVTVSAIPSLPSSVLGSSACKVGTTVAVSMSAVCASGTTPTWYSSIASTSALATSAGYSPSISATTTFYVGCKDNTSGCETAGANRSAVVATVVNAPSAPTITLGTGSSSTVCNGTSVTLNTSCSTGNVLWSTGATTTAITVTPSTTTIYTATCSLTSPITCASPASTGFTVTVNQIPAQLTITGGGASICIGGSATFTASACAGAYLWSNGATTSSITVSPTLTTNYTVTCTVNNCNSPASANACVTVTPIPSAPTSANLKGDAICQPGVVNLTATCGTGEIAQWYNGNTVGATFLFAGSAYSPNINNTTTYYVACKNTATGCETATGARASVIGTVNPNLPAPLATNVKADSTCGIGTVNFQATCGIGQTPQWYNGTSGTSTFLFAGATYSPTLTAVTTLYVGCKDDNTGCETAPANRRPVTGTYIGEVTNGGLVAANQANCGPFVPNKLTNVSLPLGSTTTVEYIWLKNLTGSTTFDPNDSNWIKVIGSTASEYQPGTISKTTSFIRCSRSAGCEFYTGESNILIITINPIPNPPTNAKSGKGVVCINEIYTLSATCGANEIVKWYDGSGALITNLVITATAAGTYNYSVGCKETITSTKCETLEANRAKVSVMVNSIPTAPTDAKSDKGSICIGEFITLSATCGEGEEAKWYDAAGVALTSLNFAPSPIGTYNYYVGCKNTFTGCETAGNNRAKVTVIVDKIPSQPLASSNKGKICLGETFSLSATCGTNEIAVWYSSTPIGATFTTLTFTPTVSGTLKYYASCKSNTGAFCETFPANRKEVIVIVNDNPVATASVKDNTVCTGSSIELVGGADGNTYSWKGPDNFTSNVQNPTIANALPNATGVYTVLIKDTNGCTATATASVVVNALPTATAMGTEVCVGKTATISVSPVFSSYAWTKVGGTFTASTQNPTIAVAATVGDAGTYQVLVTDAKGCTAIATTTVVVTVLPIPTASNNGPVCVGTEIKLEAKGGTSYSWKGPDSFTSILATPSILVADKAKNEGVYTVTVTNAKGCTETATTSVIVNTNPAPVATSNVTICYKETVQLGVNGATGTYSWKSSDGFTSTEQSPRYKPASANTYTYTVTVTGGGGCTGTATTSVIVKPNPVVTLSSTTICAGSTGTIIASGADTYSWTGPGSFTATGANPVVTIEGLYTVIGTNAGGCVGTATALLTIKANPTVSITGKTTICTVGSTTLTANSNGTYLWSGPNNFSATSKDVSVDKTGLYTVTVSNNGCQATGTVNVVADEVYVKAIGQVVCEGIKKTDLTSIISTKSGILSYAWIGSDGFTSTEQSPWIFKPTASATYTLTVITNAGCKATATATITVTPAPTGTYAVTFCKGGKATLTANGGFNATYSWTGGFTTSSIQVSTAGTYDVTITDTSGCISKGKFFVTESAAASAIITGNTSLCALGSTKLTVNEGATGETYTWSGVGGFNSTSQMITVSTSGDYAVLVKTQQGCEGIAKVTVTAGFTPTAVCGLVCEGDSIKFTATQLRGLTYSWSKNGTFISSSADPKLLNVQKSDAGVYQVVITGFGCTATVVATLVVYDRPTGLTATAINSTCDGDVSKNDGQVKLTGVFTGLKYDIVEGATYTGTKKYANATDIPANGIVKSSIANPAIPAGTKYTVRVFNANNCYTDYTVTIQQVTCSCGVAKCVPYGVTKTKSGKK